MTLPSTPAQLPLATQLTRFVVTGVISAVVDFGLLAVGMRAGLDPTTAKAISFVAGTTTAYLINRRWTFQAEGSKRRFAAVVVLYGLTFVLQVGIFSWLYAWLVGRGYGPAQGSWLNAAQIIGFVVAQGVATSVNFVVQRSVIFRS